MENVTARMTEEDIALPERLSEQLDGGRSEAIRTAVRRGAREELVRIAVERYRAGEVGMRGAARIAGLSVGEMMHEASERGITVNYDPEELAGDVEALR